MTNDMTKKYILKPGKHQFAPGSPAVHSNDSINDAEAKWYLEKYPHIANLFIQIPKNAGDAKPRKKTQEVKSVIIKAYQGDALANQNSITQ